jgi:glucose/mannose transport system substrate-binding protein
MTLPSPAGASRVLEIFSWWTAGTDAEAFAAMLKVFHATDPDVEIVNSAATAGEGIDPRSVLATRMQGGEPPDSFQAHAGHEMTDTYVAAGQVEPVTRLFEEQGWSEVMPRPLVSLLSHEGQIWSVPVNIHRVNMLWFNKAVFDAHGLRPPATIDEFFTVAEALKKVNITPLALGESWTQVQLFETVLLGSLGPEAYMGLWTGTTDWRGVEVTHALENFKRMLDYANKDFAVLSWDRAAHLLMDGAAPMYVMGDWAEVYFKAQGWNPGGEFGWTPSPGTAGSFDALSDSFALPKGAPNPDAALAWLKVCGSREGQDAFNSIKGSIPARIDGDRSPYDVYQQSAMDDFSKDVFVASMTHGAAVAPSWQQAIINAVDLFVASRDVAAFQSALVRACQDAEVCQ